jgi:hypothetical protein
LNLKCDFLVSKLFAFKFNLYHYITDLELKGLRNGTYNMTFSLPLADGRAFAKTVPIRVAPCANGQIGTVNGACECAPGYTLGATGCMACRDGYYKPRMGSAPCTQCPDPRLQYTCDTYECTLAGFPATDVTQCKCRAGWWRKGFHDGGCKAHINPNVGQLPVQSEPANGTGASRENAVAAGVAPFLLTVLDEYGGEKFCGCELCPGGKDACAAEDAATGVTQCAVGSSGPLCASCSDVNNTKYVWDGAQCTACGGASTFLSTAVVVIFALFVGSIVYQSEVSIAESLKKVQSLISAPGGELRDAIQETLGKIPRPMQTIKVMIGYFQVIGSMPVSFNIDVTVVPLSLKRFLSIMGFFNFDPSASLKCFGMRYNFFDRLTLMCSIPIVLFAVTLVSSFLIAVLVRSSIKRSIYLKLRSKIILFLVVFFHPSVSTSIFQLFNCVQVDGYKLPFLKADYTLQCFDAQWSAYAVLGLATAACYTVGMPVAFAAMLYRRFNTLSTARKALADAERVHRLANSWLASAQRAADNRAAGAKTGKAVGLLAGGLGNWGGAAKAAAGAGGGGKKGPGPVTEGFVNDDAQSSMTTPHTSPSLRDQEAARRCQYEIEAAGLSPGASSPGSGPGPVTENVTDDSLRNDAAAKRRQDEMINKLYLELPDKEPMHELNSDNVAAIPLGAKMTGWNTVADVDQQLPPEAIIAAERNAKNRNKTKTGRLVQTSQLNVDKVTDTWQELGFLHQDYNERTYYWEIIEICRRVILTAIIVVVGEYVKGFDLVIGSLLAFGFIGLQLYFRPYENSKLQFLQTVSLTDQYLVIFLFMLMTVARGSEEWDTNMIGYFIVAIQVVMLVFAVWLTMYSAYDLTNVYADVVEQIKTVEVAERKAKEEEERALKHLSKLKGAAGDDEKDKEEEEEEGEEEVHKTKNNTRRNAPAEDDEHQEVSATGAIERRLPAQLLAAAAGQQAQAGGPAQGQGGQGGQGRGGGRGRGGRMPSSARAAAAAGPPLRSLPGGRGGRGGIHVGGGGGGRGPPPPALLAAMAGRGPVRGAGRGAPPPPPPRM